MYRNFGDIINKAVIKNPQKMVMVGAEEENSLIAIQKASQSRYIEPILVGEKERILSIMDENNIELTDVAIIDAVTYEDKCNLGCEVFLDDNCFMMKGLVETSDLLRAIIKRKKDIMSSNLVSHISLIELPYYGKIIGLSDTSVNIEPDIDDKVEIIKNARDFFKGLEYKLPKISILSSIEKVNSKMKDTMDADVIKKLYLKGMISDCIIEGPISLDLSIDKKAAEIKKYDGLIKGDADILIAPNLVSGNLLGKSFNYTPNSKFAGFILGTKKPVALTSRASSVENKFFSMVIGSIISAREKQ